MDSPHEPRFLMDEDEEQQDSFVDTGLEDDDNWDDSDHLVQPHGRQSQWPQSYRKSMDIYSHMPSPSFLNSSASKSFLLPVSSKSLLPALSPSGTTEPLLLDQHSCASKVSLIDKQQELAESKQSLVKCPQQTYQDCHLKLPEQGCSFFQTLLNGINVLAGVGVLSTPYALKQAGWVGLLVLLLFAVLCCYTGILLRRCLESGSGLVTYPDIGQAAFGKFGRMLISIILYIELYACCVEFLILEGDNLGSLFQGASFSVYGYQLEPHKSFAIIAALLILPTVWLRDLSVLSYLSAGGVLASIIVVLSVLWVGTIGGVGFKYTGPAMRFQNLPVAFGLFGFCFSGHAVFPNIYSSMKNGTQFNRVLQICFGFCILMYGGVAVMGYRMFGDNTLSQVTLNLPNGSTASKIALWTTVITPLTKYALSITPVALSLEELLPQKSYFTSVLIRSTLVVSTLFVALLVPFFGFVMAFIGAFLSMTGSLILPCACYLSIYGKNLTVRQRLTSVLTIFVGTIAAVSGTYTSISGIIDQYRH